MSEHVALSDPSHEIPATDAIGSIEVRGIDYIPSDERHGRPRELFWVWFAANIAYLYFTLGGFILLLGLTLPQAILVIIIGNVYWVGVGFLAISGPASGSPSVVVTRAMFGIRGNRPLSAGIGWIIAICYEFINLAIGALAGFALAERFGMEVTPLVKIAILLFIAAVTFSVSIYGHATIAKVSPYSSGVLAFAMVLLGVFVVAGADFSFVPETPLNGPDTAAAMFVGIAIIAAIPLSWGTGADYARYLPRSTSPRKVMMWTALGGFIPSVAIGILGVIAGTSIDMYDAQASLESILPAWFYPILLAVILFSSMTSNVLTAYSSGFCLQGLGVKMSRAKTVFLDALVSIALAAYVLLVSNFLDSLSQALEITVVVLAPSMAIYIVDIILRRSRYSGTALHDERPGARHWYRGGWSIAGVSALVAGVAASLLTANTSLYQAPIASALGGADISVIVGPVVAAIVYWLLWPVTRGDEKRASEQSESVL